MKIFVIEDETVMSELICSALKREGYEVEIATTLQSAMEKLEFCEYECILLDIMLPDGSGLDILKWIKKRGRKENVIILSARGSVEDKVEGLEFGADDYLAKPFHLLELLARLRTVARRRRGGNMMLSCGNISADTLSRVVYVNGQPLHLLKKEYAILVYFLGRQGHIIDKEQLAEAIWGDAADSAYSYDFVYSQIKNLRQKLSASGAGAAIRSVYGFGYKLEETDEN